MLAKSLILHIKTRELKTARGHMMPPPLHFFVVNVFLTGVNMASKKMRTGTIEAKMCMSAVERQVLLYNSLTN